MTTQEQKERWEAFLMKTIDLKGLLRNMFDPPPSTAFVELDFPGIEISPNKFPLSLPAPEVPEHDTRRDGSCS